MKENKCDGETFSAAYSRFPRGVDGLRSAGEWYELRRPMMLLVSARK